MMLATLVSACAFGAIRLSEVLPDPSRVDDSRGEYVEIENTGDGAHVDGFRLVVGGKDTVVVSGDTVPGSGFWVLARALEADNGGFRPNRAVPSGWTLANGAGEVRLLDGGGAEIDAFSWSASTPGVAFERCPDGTWKRGASVFGIGDRGTPGAPNSCDSAPRPIEGRVESLVRQGDSLCATVRNRGLQAWDSRVLEWREGGVVVRGESLDLESGRSIRTCHPFSATRSARSRWVVRLPPDVRSGDDSLGLWVREPDGDVVIAELQAADPGPEWIEIAQRLDRPLEVGGWSIGAEEPRGVVPVGAVMPSAGRLVLSSDCAALRALVGVATLPCAEPSPWPRLSVENDVATLRDADGGLWDSVSWNRAEWGAWPKGRTRERQDVAPFGGAEAWLPSAAEGGTPGYGPAEAPGWSDGAAGIHSFRIAFRRVRPRDPERALRMEIVAPRSEELRVDLYDMGRRQLLRIHEGEPPRGGSLLWDGRDARGRDVRPGVYVVVAEFGSEKSPAWKAREWIVVVPGR